MIKTISFTIVGCLCLASVVYVLAVGLAVRFGIPNSTSIGLPSGGVPVGFVGQVWEPILELDNTKARPVYRAYMSVWGVRYYEPDW